MSESESIVAAMHANELQVDYIVFPDEGHGIEAPRKSLALYAVIEKFLAKQLGGRFEPIGGAINDSSVQWKSKSGTGSIGNK